MNYDRFSELWDALVVISRTKTGEAVQISNGMTQATATALIEYGQGNKDKVNTIRLALGRPAIQ